MVKSVKRSMALKGNTNAKGARGGATVGAIGGIFGFPGSLAAGMIAQNHANKTLGTKNKAQGERVLSRQRKTATAIGAGYGALATGTKAAIAFHPAGLFLGKGAGPLIMASGMGMTKGALVAGAAGAVLGGVVAGGANYLASRAGSAIIGGPKTNTPKQHHARTPAEANARKLQKHMAAGKPLPTFGTVKL